MNLSLEQEITQTLEHCLAKISEKLKTTFDPIEKRSIQLLQQYRSTISTYRTWLKNLGKTVSDNTQKPKTEKVSQTHPSQQTKDSSHLKQAIINKEKDIAQLLKKYNKQPSPKPPITQPSGLLMSPA